MNKSKSSLQTPFRRYSKYVLQIQHLASESQHASDWNTRVDAALNGQANVELRRSISLKTRRKFGAFFTGTSLCLQLSSFFGELDDKSFFYDPTCGMGDLLIAAARKLPLAGTLAATLKQWGRQLAGTDLHCEFIEGAKTRLALLARQRHSSQEVLEAGFTDLFPNICVADGRQQKERYKLATHLLLNPPFGQVETSLECTYAGGRFTEAASFVVTALERSDPGTRLFAVLPEVLRSGAFSNRWRNRISQLASIKLVRSYGVFDKSADVDVFLLKAIRTQENRAPKPHLWATTSSSGKTIADFFNVHVGRVVPHRDVKAGKRHPYIHARGVPAWKVMRQFTEFRKHRGLPYKPPFVAIRRTSRPGDLFRATASIVAGNKSVAVENHLIVCEPKDGTLSSCKILMKRLRSKSVNEFLNNRIRCRHLTVGSVREIPWKS